MNEMDFKEYLAFLRDLGVTLGEITTVEQEKAKFVRMDDLDGLLSLIHISFPRMFL